MTKSLILRRGFARMSFLVLSSLAVTAPAYAESQLASLDIKADAKLDLDLFDGVKASIGARYEVEPSYNGEFHLRMDRGHLGASVNLVELFKGSSERAGITLEPNTEFLYVRPYKSKSAALHGSFFGYKGVPTSKRELLGRFPLTSENLINNFNAGDFFSINTHLNLLVNAGTLPLSATTAGFIGTHYLLSGEFQIHLYKMADQKVRMKIIVLRKKEAGVRVGLGLKDNKILGLKMVDRRIEKALNMTQVFELAADKLESNLNMGDYVLDLSDERVRKAYDGLLVEVKPLSLDKYKELNPTKGDASLKDLFVSDVTPFENLYASEYGKPAEQRSVNRFFKGNNDIKVGSRTRFKFSPILFKFKNETEYFENMMTSENENGSKDYLRLHTFQRTKEASLWFSYFKATSVSRASMLFDSNEQKEIGSIRDIMFEWNYRDKSLDGQEVNMIKDAVAQALPGTIESNVNWGSFTENKTYKNARFIYKMVLNPKALQSLQSMSSGHIYGMLEKYIQTIPAPTADPGFTQKSSDVNSNAKMTVVEKYQDSMLTIAHYMAKVADTRLSNKERSDAFSELRFNSLFIEMGPGFLLSLLPSANLEKLVQFDISLVADGGNSMQYTFGSIEDRKIYTDANYIQSVLTANEFETITQMMNTSK